MLAARAPRLQSIQGSDHSALKHYQRTLRRVARVASLGAAGVARRKESSIDGCALLITEYRLALAAN